MVTSLMWVVKRARDVSERPVFDENMEKWGHALGEVDLSVAVVIQRPSRPNRQQGEPCVCGFAKVQLGMGEAHLPRRKAVSSSMRNWRARLALVSLKREPACVWVITSRNVFSKSLMSSLATGQTPRHQHVDQFHQFHL